MKNINSNWLGTPPEHWKALKLRQILRPFSEKNHADLQLLSVVREKGVIVRDTENDDNHNYIEKHGNKDIKMVEKTALSGFYNKSEIDFIKKHIIPEPGKSGDYEIAYGVFLGYTLGLNSTGLSSAEYKEKVNRRLELDIKQHASYIANKIITKGLDGHSFYFYILPFNDAETDKKEIMEHIMKGEVTL